MRGFFERHFNIFITFCSGIVVLSQWYLENIENLVPCNLCIIQKTCAQAIFFIYLIKMVSPYLRPLFDVSAFLSICLGIGASGRQIYLISLPRDQLPAGLCDLPFEAVFNIYPFFEGIQKIFLGSSKCAQEDWWFLGINIAEWSFIFFASMMLISLLRYLFIILQGHKYN
jgi:disulfide bond formation protein DsbB